MDITSVLNISIVVAAGYVVYQALNYVVGDQSNAIAHAAVGTTSGEYYANDERTVDDLAAHANLTVTMLGQDEYLIKPTDGGTYSRMNREGLNRILNEKKPNQVIKFGSI